MSFSRLRDVEDRRSCWVCFATDEDDYDSAWVRPCKCRGTSKWVHQNCLQRWIDEKQKGNSNVKVACPQCNTEYTIIFPKVGPVIYTLEMMNHVINKMCPFVAGGIVIGSVYWTAVTYGAVTVMQVLGHKEGLNVMEKADPLFLIMGLPAIPAMLILGKMVRWEDYVLRHWRKHSSKLPILNYFFPGDHTRMARIPAEMDKKCVVRILNGALILPTIAAIVGKVLFGSVESNFQRTLLGGIAFITIKGALKIYYKQQQYMRQANRVIMNYEDKSPPAPAPASSPSSSSSPPPHIPPQGEERVA